MRVFFDTEFTTLQADADVYLISAGFVAEDGREWYAEITDFPHHQCSDFVLAHVLPLLDAPEEIRFTEATFALKLVEWLNAFAEPVDLFCDSPIDWTLLADAIREARSAMRFPLRALVDQSDSFAARETEYRFWQQAENRGRQHHALYDARCLRAARLAHESAP